MPIPLDVIRRLPKTDLHLHLDGSLRPRSVWELAREQGIKLRARTPAELERVLRAGKRTKSLKQYLKIFDITLSVLQDKEALRRVSYELVEDCARENCRHIEVRYSPILHQKRGLSLPDIVEPVLEGLQLGQREFGVSTGVIICGMRNISPKRSLELAELAVAYRKKGVVGFDLAGEEKDFPPKHHREAFYLVLNHNINCTVHAGEGFGPPSISQALHYCGAHRIGHGTRLGEDIDLMNYVLDRRIPLEVCLTSNVQTGTVRSIREHPFGKFLKLGLRVTLNTDNTMVSDTTISREYALAARSFGLSPYAIKRIIVNGFKSSFLPYAVKSRMLRRAILDIDFVFMDAYPDTYDRAASVL